MTRKQVFLLVALGALAALLIGLALRNPQPPILPSDAAHSDAAGGPECLSCHGPTGPSPQSRNHPVGQDCLRCHGTG